MPSPMAGTTAGNANLAVLSDAVIDIVAEHAYSATLTEVVRDDVPHGWRSWPSACGATAYPERDVDHNMSIDAVWLPGGRHCRGG